MDIANPALPDARDDGTLRWRRAVRGGVAGSAGRGLALFLSLVVTPVAINRAGSTTYGLFAALTAFATLLAFSDFGIGNGVIRELVAVRAKAVSATGNTARDVAAAEGPITATALLLLIVLGIAIAAIGAAAAFILPWRTLLNAPSADTTSLRYGVVAVAVCTGCAVPGAFAQKIYLARQRSAQAGLWAAAAGVAASVALLIVVLGNHRLPLMVVAVLGAPAAVGVAALLWLAHTRTVSFKTHQVSLAVAKTLIRSGRLFAVLQFVAIMNFEIDNLIVARILGPTKVTQFAATSGLFAIPLALAAMFFTPLWSAFGDAVALQDIEWVRRAYRRSTTTALRILAPTAALLVILGRPAVHAWTRGAVHAPLSLIIALALWLVVYGFNQPQAMLLNALHVERFQILTATANLAVNLSLSILFTIEFGVSGPIWGTLAAQVCVVVATTLYLRRLNASWPAAR
jgi:O-antigen/teichoic acid export membrane protein